MDEHETQMPRILVVDDLVENTAILTNFLTPKGYYVIAAHSGEEALRKVQETPPDVILLDLVMPDMDGFEVCHRLKQSRTTRHIPVVVITGRTEKEANVRAIEAGADDFLRKPFDSVLLDARIRSSLRSKALQDQIIRYQRQLEESNDLLEERIGQRTAQLERTQQVTVFSLAKLAESRDTETGDHLERMRSYAREIALELNSRHELREAVSDQFVDALYQSCPLHDIGKVGIPDRILLKPGKLTKEEFEIMKSHTLIGGDTLKAAVAEAGENPFLSMGRDIAYYHHEKWDGSGYPTGLKSTEIPLSARICALADVYDALSSKRPYKEPFSHEMSKEIILQGRGTHFDADVIDAFLARETRFTEIRTRHQSQGRLARIQEIIEHLDRVSPGEDPGAS